MKPAFIRFIPLTHTAWLYAILLIFLLGGCAQPPPPASFPTPTLNRALDIPQVTETPQISAATISPLTQPTALPTQEPTAAEVIVTAVIEDTPPAEAVETAEPTDSPEVPAAPTLPYSPDSFPAALSTDGRYLAFSSGSRDLVENDINEAMDAFVYDRDTDTIERVSVTSQGGEANGTSMAQDISGDGRYVLFQSQASNLFPDGVQASSGLFLYDRETKQVTFLEIGQSEVSLGYVGVRGELSPDGQRVLIEAYHPEALPADRSDTRNIYLYNRGDGTLRLLSQAPDGTPASGDSYAASISPDGLSVVFFSTASNLIADDSACSEQNSNCKDLFAYFLDSNRVQRVAIGFPGGAGGPSDAAQISDRGAVVAFNAPEAVNPPRIQLISLNPRSMEVLCVTKENSPCAGFAPVLSDDGRRVAFVTPPRADANGRWQEGSFAQVYLYDRQGRILSPVSVDDAGQPGDANSGMIVQSEGYSKSLALSGNGRWIAFASQAANLLPEGTAQPVCFSLLTNAESACYQILLYDTLTRETTLVAAPSE